METKFKMGGFENFIKYDDDDNCYYFEKNDIDMVELFKTTDYSVYSRKDELYIVEVVEQRFIDIEELKGDMQCFYEAFIRCELSFESIKCTFDIYEFVKTQLGEWVIYE